jgi:dTDP-glucose pyrophosphorylase
MRQKYPDLIVNKQDSIIFVLKKMDRTKRKVLIVMDESKFSSVISIGDIQRAIIKGIDIHSSIYNILRHDVTVASSGDELDHVKASMKIRRNELMPVVSPSGELIDVILWEDLFEEAFPTKAPAKLNLPVIIMAGGEGTRLRPLTNVLPKALIPIRSKTMIEEIMDRFLDCGCQDFYLSVNYKAEMIHYYFESLQNSDYHIKYIQEDKPLGTAGSLHLLKNKIDTSFFVTNCDIIIDQNYCDILNYHRENKNEITIVAAIKNYSIPYGTLTSREDGLLQSLQEKPEFVFKINTGFYILEPNLLKEIPQNTIYHITTLIEQLRSEDRRIGVFPVSENSWTDIGNWNEYYGHICQHE